jgi:hypothetical protein
LEQARRRAGAGAPAMVASLAQAVIGFPSRNIIRQGCSC